MRLPVIIAAAAVVYSLIGAPSAVAGERGWSHYGGSMRGQQYSPLDQIQPGNVQDLSIAWTFRTGELGEGTRRGFTFESNPIVVDGRLYVSTGSGIVIALDPVRGEELWRYDPEIDRDARYSEVSNRGVTAWRDPGAEPGTSCALRIFSVTLDARIISLDGVTGELCRDFGDGGQLGLHPAPEWIRPGIFEYSITSPPVLVDGVLVTGSALADNRRVDVEPGIVRGLDARTGKERWRWDPVPRTMADPAHVGWKDSQAKRVGGGNAWAPLAADESLGLVYVPTGSASPDFFGGERVGQNVYANSLVALEAGSGHVRWHQQLVHHDLWDYDLASQPTLVELQRSGRSVPAVIQATKMGLLFAFDRRDGSPLFPLEERAVPQTDVMGEDTSPTQLFPLSPPPLVRTAALTPDDAWGVALWDKWWCSRRIAELRSEGIYTPPSLEGSVVMPSFAGGSNWGGVAFDESSQTLIANTTDLAMVVRLVPREEFERPGTKRPRHLSGRQTGTPYGVLREPLVSPWGLPCVAPPWGQLSAVNMVSGEILWQVPLGTIEDAAPALLPNLKLGMPNTGGPIVTGGGLIFIGAAMDDYLRAFDLKTGTELWKGRLPAGGQATPMSFWLDQTGRQYVVIAAGGHTSLNTRRGDYLVAFALADAED